MRWLRIHPRHKRRRKRRLRAAWSVERGREENERGTMTLHSQRGEAADAGGSSRGRAAQC